MWRSASDHLSKVAHGVANVALSGSSHSGMASLKGFREEGFAARGHPVGESAVRRRDPKREAAVLRLWYDWTAIKRANLWTTLR